MIYAYISGNEYKTCRKDKVAPDSVLNMKMEKTYSPENLEFQPLDFSRVSLLTVIINSYYFIVTGTRKHFNRLQDGTFVIVVEPGLPFGGGGGGGAEVLLSTTTLDIVAIRRKRTSKRKNWVSFSYRCR